jgi:hypothetical protein
MRAIIRPPECPLADWIGWIQQAVERVSRARRRSLKRRHCGCRIGSQVDRLFRSWPIRGRWRVFDEIEDIVVPDIHLPAAGKGFGDLRDELGQPHQIVGGGSEGEGPFNPVAATEPGLVLIRPNVSSIRLRMRRLTAWPRCRVVRPSIAELGPLVFAPRAASPSSSAAH